MCPTTESSNKVSKICAQWGLYQWFEEHGPNLIHPDDLDAVRKETPGNRVLQVVNEDEEFLTLRSGDYEFRGRPSLFKKIDVPLRAFGSEVELRDGRRGYITDIRWHFQKRLPMYHLTIGGKLNKSRFWESDFI
ncbi:DUF6960 family protein [Nannocystis bainbridge]|uniref:DUF6960 family protein n=1 Tax=Nannocystis bainbridge TaxID=2995303 RepID=UPI00358DD378